jgi:uncharacterized protein YbaR (Trm112 family)
MGEDILRCQGCKTRYDISRYSPGNRFRCRRCGLTLQVPARGAWKRTGEWEIDVEKSLVKCNRCHQAYPLDAHAIEGAFVCKKCRRVFSGLRELVEGGPAPSGADEEWEIDVETGQIVCPGCRYGYDLTSHPPGTDFVCRHCGRVFRMPKEIPASEKLERREKIACPKCGASYDVSGYLRGTMFSCDRCQEVLNVGASTVTVAPREKDIPEPPAVRVRRDSDRIPVAAPSSGPETAARREGGSPAGALPAPTAAEVPAPAPAAPAPESPAAPPPPAPEPAAPPAAEPPRPGVSWEERTVELEPEASEPSEPSPAEAGPGPTVSVSPRLETPAAVEAPPPEPAPAPSEPPAAPAREPPPDATPDVPGPPAGHKVPVPFPPMPPGQIPGADKPKKPAMVVKCTVCGTKHDASGKAPGDKIQCKCGKHIRIKGPKKGAAPAPAAPAPAAETAKNQSPQDADIEILMKRKTVRSEDIEVIKGDKKRKL